MPPHFTWKSIMGALAAAGAPVTLATAEPHGVLAWALLATGLGGWAVVGLERLADSKDFATVMSAAGETAEIAKVKAEGDRLLSDAKATIATLAPKAEQFDRLVQAAAAPPAPAPVAPPAAG